MKLQLLVSLLFWNHLASLALEPSDSSFGILEHLVGQLSRPLAFQGSLTGYLLELIQSLASFWLDRLFAAWKHQYPQTYDYPFASFISLVLQVLVSAGQQK